MFYLKHNVPGWERAVRLTLGIATAVAGYYLLPAGMLQWVSYLSGASLALTGIIGFCPACALVGRRIAERQS